MTRSGPNTLASPVSALMRRWPLALALIVVCGLAGLVVGTRMTPTYTAEARVAVGPGDMSAGAIAGFPQATRNMAADYSRWVTQQGLVEVPEGVALSASPVPESNVIRVIAEGSDETAARSAADAAAKALVTKVNAAREETDPAVTTQAMQEAAGTWAGTKTELDRATYEFNKVNNNEQSTDRQYNAAATVLTRAQTAETTAKVQLEALSERFKTQATSSSTSADLRSIAPAEVITDTRRALALRYAVFGAAVGLLIALVTAVWRERRRHRS